MAQTRTGRQAPRPAATSLQRDVDTRAAASAARTDQPDAPPARRIKVRATQTGYYDHTRRRPGDVFTIADELAFSKLWMERVDAATPERTTTPNEAIRQEHDAILALKAQPGLQVGPDNVPDDLPTGTANPLGND